MAPTKKIKKVVFSSQQEIISEYLYDIYRPQRLAKIVNGLARKIESISKKTKIDAIAFTGQSGSAVAYSLSYKLGIPLICIRKGKGISHYNDVYEGVCYPVDNYIIVDDFIDSGRTVARIRKNVKSYCKYAKLACIVLYGSRVMKSWKGTKVYATGLMMK